MEQPPRRGNSLFSDGMVSSIALEGAMIGMLALLAFGIGHIYFDEEGAYYRADDGVCGAFAFAADTRL